MSALGTGGGQSRQARPLSQTGRPVLSLWPLPSLPRCQGGVEGFHPPPAAAALIPISGPWPQPPPLCSPPAPTNPAVSCLHCPGWEAAAGQKRMALSPGGGRGTWPGVTQGAPGHAGGRRAERKPG